MEIIDNFIPKDIFTPIQEKFLEPKFPWHWCDSKSFRGEKDGDDILCDELYNHQFVHWFFYHTNRVSDNWDIVEPILNFLDIKALIRIKANLNVRTHEIVTYGFHTDVEYGDVTSKTAIFYINTNNGKTIFENGSEVDSIENRIVLFDSNLVHTGTSCTDQKRRIVLNFNYF